MSSLAAYSAPTDINQLAFQLAIVTSLGCTGLAATAVRFLKLDQSVQSAPAKRVQRSMNCLRKPNWSWAGVASLAFAVVLERRVVAERFAAPSPTLSSAKVQGPLKV